MTDFGLGFGDYDGVDPLDPEMYDGDNGGKEPPSFLASFLYGLFLIILILLLLRHMPAGL